MECSPICVKDFSRDFMSANVGIRMSSIEQVETYKGGGRYGIKRDTQNNHWLHRYHDYIKQVLRCQ